MAHVVTDPCIGCRYTDCVVVCPMECFYGDEKQLYIDPIDCIDCGACIPECPAEAIYLDVNVPQKYRAAIAENAERSAKLKEEGAKITERIPR